MICVRERDAGPVTGGVDTPAEEATEPAGGEGADLDGVELGCEGCEGCDGLGGSLLVSFGEGSFFGGSVELARCCRVRCHCGLEVGWVRRVRWEGSLDGSALFGKSALMSSMRCISCIYV